MGPRGAGAAVRGPGTRGPERQAEATAPAGVCKKKKPDGNAAKCFFQRKTNEQMEIRPWDYFNNRTQGVLPNAG